MLRGGNSLFQACRDEHPGVCRRPVWRQRPGRIMVPRTQAEFAGAGRDKTVGHRVMRSARVVSMISSATETVAALGCEDRLVARSHECDFPPRVQQLPPSPAPKTDITR